MFKNILVTGGAGFIGSHVCESIMDKSEKVICVDNFNDYYDPGIKQDNIGKLKSNPKFKLFKEDITDIKSLEKIFIEEDIDAIVHIAARAGVRASIENPFLYEKVNVLGTLNILELARKYKVKKIIFTSSSSVYGLNKNVPFSEQDLVNNIISPYAATKLSAELLCKAYHNMYGIPIICLRLFTVFGPRGRPDMAPFKFMDLIDKGKSIPVYGDGKSKRDFTFVGDIVEGIKSALFSELKFEIINLGNSNPFELNEFIEILEVELGKKANIDGQGEQKGDVPMTYADISKAKRLLNYDPKVSLKEGVKRMVEWYKQKGN